MATTVSYNGTNYTVPQTGDSGWGTTLTTYLVALASGSLTKAGGLMTLTAELDLGANFGLKSVYFSARGTPATAGAYRLENNTSVSWRNAANDGNLDLLVNASNNLTWKNTFKIQNTGGGFTALAHDTQGLELQSTAMNSTSKYCPPIKFMCADTDIATNNPRCIAYIAAKTVGTVNSDTTATGVLEFATLPGGEAAATMPTVRAAIDHNGNFGVANLAGSGSRLVRASAAGNLSATAADIVNADISASAAIAYSKLAALTSANILVGSAANVATSVAMTGDVTISNAGVTTLASSLSGSRTINGTLSVLGASTSPTSIGHTTQGFVLRSTDTSLSTGDYFPPIRWEATDSTLATTNPKTTAWIAAKSTENFDADNKSGTQIDFATSPNAGGTSVVPVVGMSLGQDGILTLNNGAKMDDAADQSTLDYYRTENVSLDWQFNGTSPGAAVANTTRITRIGNIVHFHLGIARATTGTGSTILSSVAWPSWVWPTRTTVIKGVHIRNSGASDTTSIGVFQINTSDGVASIYRDLSLTAFANSTSCGVQTSFSGCYAIE